MVWEHYEDRIALLCTVMTRHMGFVGQKDRSSCKLTWGAVPADLVQLRYQAAVSSSSIQLMFFS
jgi:hypothetical protein